MVVIVQQLMHPECFWLSLIVQIHWLVNMFGLNQIPPASRMFNNLLRISYVSFCAMVNWLGWISLFLGVSSSGIIVPIVRIPIIVWMMIPHIPYSGHGTPIACNSSTHMTILPSDYCKLPITPKRLPNNTHWKENSWQWSKVLGSLYCHLWWCCWRCVGPTACSNEEVSPFRCFLHRLLTGWSPTAL